MIESQFPNLFSEITIGNCVIPNRIVSTGHHTYLSDVVPDERLVAYHQARAKGGAGLIVSEIVAAHASAGFSSNLLQARDHDAIPAYQKLTRACHQHGSKMFAQLFHPGREVLSSPSGMLPVAWAPSAVPNERFHIMPKPMPVEMIVDVVAGHGNAAAILAEAGFDGFEIVANHGYLPAQFLNPRTNLRQDEYGGDDNGRRKFLVGLIQQIRKSAPGLVVGLRISGNEMDDLGLTLDEVVTNGRALAPLLDYLSIVAGTSASLAGSVHIVPPMGIDPGYVSPQSEVLRHETSLPVIVTGRINQPQVAEQIIARGEADLCGMTRAMICDPDMAIKAKRGQFEQIRACIGCNQSCIGRAHKGLGISCIQHPESGREIEFATLPEIDRSKKIMVVGGGPAGMKAAAIAAARGHQVSLHEQQLHLGGQAQLAADLPGREDFAGITENLSREMTDAGVQVSTNSMVTLETISVEQPDQVILATGALPLLPDFAGNDLDNVVTAWGILNNDVALGQRVVIADWRSDWIGLGLAEKLAREGRQVTLFTNAAMAGETLQIYTRNHYLGRVKKLGVDITAHARLYGFDGDTVFFQDTITMEPIEVESVDTLVLSMGHSSLNRLELELKQTNIEYHCIGDCVTPRTAEEAVYDGLQIAWNI